jgi:hypothetical protein
MDAQQLRRRKGQTLAEFALTLPILLILLFGIIEFGRIFQAWVTLQNAARTAARFASTGQPFVGNDTGGYDVNSLVPCTTNDDRGTRTTITVGSGPTASTIQVYENGVEHLFATYYDGENCTPGSPSSSGQALTHYYRRTDMIRMLLIYREARRGAAGLALEPDPYDPITAQHIEDFLYDQFERPLPRSNQRQWFNVVLCSTDRKMFAGPDQNGASTRNNRDVEGRYEFVLTGRPGAPMCILNEVRNEPAAAGGLVNAGRSWMDPGGAGESINIVVQFNHPLITPLGLADYIPLQAQRVAINESFRASNAVNVLQGGAAPIIVYPTPTSTATFTPTVPPTATFTPPATNTPAPTATETPNPVFSCAAISVGDPTFFQNRVYMNIRNNNVQDTYVTRVVFNWRGVTDYPGMYMRWMTLNNEVFWLGNDTSAPTDTGTDPGFDAGSSRFVAGGNATTVWEGIFGNGPGVLSDYLTLSDFAGTMVFFANPSGGPECSQPLNVPQPTVTPTRNPSNPLPTATGTPDCASNLLRLEFVSWESFGVVKLQVVNNRTVVAPFTNFSINWQNIVTRANLAPGVLTLSKVTVGGNSPADPLTYTVWDAPAGQDAASPTVGRSEGTWRGNYNFQPRSVTPIYLDFEGTSSNLQAAFGAQLPDFNGTWFEIGCGNNNPGGGSGGSGGGGGSSGQILLNGGTFPTVAPTFTRGPTNTPRPTFTPSRTPTRGPATMTFTPRPTVPTSTPRPTNTPLPPPTSTPPPNDDDRGGN